MIPISPAGVLDVFCLLPMDLDRATLLTVSWDWAQHDIEGRRTLSSDFGVVTPPPESAGLWQHTLQSAVILQVMGSTLLICLGLLLGTTWTIQVLQSKLRRLAEERRRLNDEWLEIHEERSAIHTTRRQLTMCVHCGRPQSEFD
jgi:hypothetical protein